MRSAQTYLMAADSAQNLHKILGPYLLAMSTQHYAPIKQLVADLWRNINQIVGHEAANARRRECEQLPRCTMRKPWSD